MISPRASFEILSDSVLRGADVFAWDETTEFRRIYGFCVDCWNGWQENCKVISQACRNRNQSNICTYVAKFRETSTVMQLSLAWVLLLESSRCERRLFNSSREKITDILFFKRYWICDWRLKFELWKFHNVCQWEFYFNVKNSVVLLSHATVMSEAIFPIKHINTESYNSHLFGPRLDTILLCAVTSLRLV